MSQIRMMLLLKIFQIEIYDSPNNERNTNERLAIEKDKRYSYDL